VDRSPNWRFAGVLAVCLGGGAGLAATAVVKCFRAFQEVDHSSVTLSTDTAVTIVMAFALWVGVGTSVGYLIGDARGHAGLGIVLGLVLGVIGWIVVGLLEPTQEVLDRRTGSTVRVLHSPYPDGTTRPCPWCAEDIKAAAQLCGYCGRPVAPLVTP
jgi:hypothetical protein